MVLTAVVTGSTAVSLLDNRGATQEGVRALHGLASQHPLDAVAIITD